MKKIIALLALIPVLACLSAPYTRTQVDDMIDRNLNPFSQSIAGTNTITISAGVPARFVIDGEARNVSTGPAYMTNRWNTVENIMTASTEYDHPTYVGDVGFIWTPSVSSEGHATLSVYINDAVPKLIRTYEVSYKGESAVPKNIITTWYWGTEAGYDAKNDGIYYEIEFEHDGVVSSPSVNIYNTQ